MMDTNSNPMAFILYLRASLRRGEDPGERIQKLYQEGHKHLALPIVQAIKNLFQGIKAKSSSRRSRKFSAERPVVSLERACFELLAAYPVDRANPPVSQKIKMLRLRQSMLYGRLRQNLGVTRRLPERLEETEPELCYCGVVPRN